MFLIFVFVKKNTIFKMIIISSQKGQFQALVSLPAMLFFRLLVLNLKPANLGILAKNPKNQQRLWQPERVGHSFCRHSPLSVYFAAHVKMNHEGCLL